MLHSQGTQLNILGALSQKKKQKKTQNWKSKISMHSQGTQLNVLGHSAKLRLHKFKRIAKATKTFCGESVAWNLRCWRWTSKAFRASFQKKLDQISPPCVCIKFPGDPSGRKAKETPFTQRPLCARKSWSKTMQTRWKGIKAVKALEVFQKFYLEHLQTFRILQMLCFKDNLKLKTSFFERKMVVRVKI